MLLLLFSSQIFILLAYHFISMWVTLYVYFISSRRGALIIRRLCVLLDAERVYRELSTILEGEADLDFASTMVQVLSYA